MSNLGVSRHYLSMILSLIIKTFQLCFGDRIWVRSAQLLEVDRRAWSPDFEILEMSPLNPAAIRVIIVSWLYGGIFCYEERERIRSRYPTGDPGPWRPKWPSHISVANFDVFFRQGRVTSNTANNSQDGCKSHYRSIRWTVGCLRDR